MAGSIQTEMSNRVKINTETDESWFLTITIGIEFDNGLIQFYSFGERDENQRIYWFFLEANSKELSSKVLKMISKNNASEITMNEKIISTAFGHLLGQFIGQLPTEG